VLQKSLPYKSSIEDFFIIIYTNKFTVKKKKLKLEIYERREFVDRKAGLIKKIKNYIQK